MRRVYLDDLPRRGEYISWKNSIGHRVKFVYDDIEGDIEIVGYDGRYLTLLYSDRLNKINTSSFMACALSIIIGKISRDYKYNVGDIVNGLEILEQIRVNRSKNFQKGYKVKCIKDGYVHEKSENNLTKGNGCLVCCNRKIIKGINDIATTHPEYTKYFVNIEDAYTHSYASNKKINLKCPDCGYERSMKICKLSYYGLSCPKCSDGKSYPEKFVFGILDQLNVEFETEYSPTWSESKRYDFYIPNLECIIETHGLQHYKDSFTHTGGRNLKEEEENDIHKQQLAIYNNIKKYIVINCRESNLEWIKNSILNSELNDIFYLSKIDWLKCHEFACSSRVKEACDLWNSKIRSITEIINITKLSRGTIIKYLKQGTELGWCDYDGQKAIRKKCKVTIGDKNFLYDSMKECLSDLGIGDGIFYKLIKSKKSYKPFCKNHKHLEGMVIQYIDD